MLQKGCECREREMEKWKQNWDEVFLNEVGGGERERDKKKGGEREREKKNVLKCLETEKYEMFNTVLQLSF
jgi:hypothetical protein